MAKRKISIQCLRDTHTNELEQVMSKMVTQLHKPLPENSELATFVRKYVDKKQRLFVNGVELQKPPSIRYIYSAKNESDAKLFLQGITVDAPMTYYHVDTPNGSWAKDIKGIYKENSTDTISDFFQEQLTHVRS